MIRVVERGLETLSHLPDSPDKWKAAIDFRLAGVIALEPLGRHRQIVTTLSEASKLTEAAGDPRRTARRQIASLRQGSGDLESTTTPCWRVKQRTQ